MGVATSGLAQTGRGVNVGTVPIFVTFVVDCVVNVSHNTLPLVFFGVGTLLLLGFIVFGVYVIGLLQGLRFFFFTQNFGFPTRQYWVLLTHQVHFGRGYV